jgi:hypothetical protein
MNRMSKNYCSPLRRADLKGRIAVVSIDVNKSKVMAIGTVAVTIALLSLMASSIPVLAHTAPSGWAYPYQCCHDRDCRPVHGATVTEGPDGYVIEGTGEVVAYTDSRIKDSPDGDFHWCSVAGNDKTSTICLFVPPRAF